MHTSTEALCQITQVAHGTPAYTELVALRQAVLRTPLGLSFTPEQLAAEAEQWHFSCTLAGTLVGCLVLRPLGAGRVQMRQVAVADEWRGRGIGRQMAAYAEAWARAQGCLTLMLHARASAVGFYEAMGYATQGAEFTEVGLTHWEMCKALGQ